MPLRVDMNCDMGESFGIYTIGNDREVIKYISSSNIACGFHASDPNVMEETVRLCKEFNVMVGAHPGYPDMHGFGRRFMEVSERELINYVVYQVGALKGFLNRMDMPLQHVKLHGALYNYMVNEEELFLKMISTIRKAFGDVIFLTLSTGRMMQLKKKCIKEGIRLALEAFPDRQYTDNGELLSRKHKDAVMKDHDEIARRAVKMVKEKGLKSVNGRWIDMEIDTLCIHGDNLQSIEAARKIRFYATREGIEIAPLAECMQAL
jgi:5-oxoprolinase (ATP-hydrolysing) subunit A